MTISWSAASAFWMTTWVRGVTDEAVGLTTNMIFIGASLGTRGRAGRAGHGTVDGGPTGFDSRTGSL